MFEQVKDYKSACAILGKKPIDKRLFALYSYDDLSSAHALVGTHLRFINKEAAEYAAKTFQPLYMKHIFGID